MKLQTIVNKLEKIGVSAFNDKNLKDITYYIDLRNGSVQIDFWNIDRVIPCKYNPNDTDLIPLQVTILYKKHARINANSYGHVLRDISSVTAGRFTSIDSITDLKLLIHEVQAVGLKFKSVGKS